MSIATSDPIRENEKPLRFEAYEDDFREHFQGIYDNTDDPYKRYAIAYRFGYDMARDFRFMDKSWDGAKSSLQEEWDADNGLTWSEAEAAIRYSWKEVRSRINDDTTTAEGSDQEYDEPFRAHYQANYSDVDNVFEYYKPAYQYGYSYGADIRQLENDNWEDIADDIRQRWENKNDDDQSTWEEFQSAIKHGWERAKEVVIGNDERNTLFNQHYLEYYEDTPTPYSAYAPAYRYGAALAIDERYGRYNWEKVETDARRQWEKTSFQGSWNDVREAVRFGWLQLRPAA